MKSGDWVIMRYGISFGLYYILNVTDEIVTWCSPKWLVSSAQFSTESEFQSRSPIVVGNTKRRWWRKYMPWRDLICPFRIFHF